MGDFYSYLSIFLSQWWWFLTSGPYVLDPLLESMSESYRWWKMRHFSQTKWNRLKIALVFVGIFFAGFFAWRDEHIQVAQKQAEIDRLGRLEPSSAQREIERLRKEIVELREGHPYTIPKEDEVEFVQTFLSVGPYVMEIVSADDDEDGKARALAKRLSDLFELSRWSVKPLESHVFGREAAPGIIIFVNREYGTSSREASLLKALLVKQDIDVRIQTFQPYEGDLHTLKIFVGPAPRYPPKR